MAPTQRLALIASLAIVAFLGGIASGDDKPDESGYEYEEFDSEKRTFNRPSDSDYDGEGGGDGSGEGGLLNFWNQPEPEPITQTVTQTRIITSTVTRNPVCITAAYNTPNCFNQPDIHKKPPAPSKPIPQPTYSKPPHHFKSDGDVEDEEVEGIEPTSVVKASMETATKQVDEVKSRSGRYLTFAKATPVISKVKDAIDDSKISNAKEDAENETGRFIRRRKVVKVTSTINVTRRRTIRNNAVTATLIASNCAPVGTKIPICGRPKDAESDESKDMKVEN